MFVVGTAAASSYFSAIPIAVRKVSAAYRRALALRLPSKHPSATVYPGLLSRGIRFPSRLASAHSRRADALRQAGRLKHQVIESP